MSRLTALRTEVADALNAASIKAIEYVGEQITPPAVVVLPAAPYMVPSQHFGHFDVNISLLVVAGKGTSKASANALDSMIEQVIEALDDWDLTEVSQPGQVNLNGSNFLGAVISIEQTIKI